MIPLAATKSRSDSRAPSLMHDLIIVGDGLVGSAAALAAAQAGFTVALVGNRHRGSLAKEVPGETWDRRVYAISPSSRRVLEAMRVWSQLDRARVSPVRDIRVFSDEFGSNAVHFSAFEASVDSLAWIVEHRELARVFDAALGFHPGVDRIDYDAIDFQADASHVAVQTEARSVHAALLIAADGPHSRMREHAGIKADVKPYDEIGIVANFECSLPHRNTARQWFTAEGTIALLPLNEQAVSLVWSAPGAIATELLRESSSRLAHRLEQIAGPILGTMSPLGGASSFPLSLLTTRTQIAQRMVIIGDAAHVIHPLAGQGLNLGFSDAACLIRILEKRESFRDCGDPILLRRYERARKADVWAMRCATDGLHRLFASDDPILRRARAFGTKLVNQLPPLKQIFMRQAMG